MVIICQSVQCQRIFLKNSGCWFVKQIVMISWWLCLRQICIPKLIFVNAHLCFLLFAFCTFSCLFIELFFCLTLCLSQSLCLWDSVYLTSLSCSLSLYVSFSLFPTLLLFRNLSCTRELSLYNSLCCNSSKSFSLAWQCSSWRVCSQNIHFIDLTPWSITNLVCTITGPSSPAGCGVHQIVSSVCLPNRTLHDVLQI